MAKKMSKEFKRFLNKHIYSNSLPILNELLSIEQKVEKAIIPIYHRPLEKKVPIQIASGVLVKIEGEYFIFSASHVFDEIKDFSLLTGYGVMTKVIALSGDRYSSVRGNSGTHQDDPIDASVFHIHSDLPLKLKELALSESDLFKKKDKNKSHSLHIAAGFRTKKSNTANYVISSKREGFLLSQSQEKVYQNNHLSVLHHFILSYPNEWLVNGERKISPQPKGFSGGGIISFVNSNNSLGTSKKYKQKLTAIIIEQRRANKKSEGILVGTRIEVFMELVRICFDDMKTNK